MQLMMPISRMQLMMPIPIFAGKAGRSGPGKRFRIYYKDGQFGNAGSFPRLVHENDANIAFLAPDLKVLTDPTVVREYPIPLILGKEISHPAFASDLDFYAHPTAFRTMSGHAVLTTIRWTLYFRSAGDAAIYKGLIACRS